MSDNLDTSAFWADVADVVYVLVRVSPEFPQVPTNSDIDVLTLDPDAFGLRVMNFWASRGFQVTARSVGRGHLQIDLSKDGSRIVMYDIYSAEGICEAAPIKPGFATWSLGRRERREIGEEHLLISVWVPAKVDEAVFRYSEYVASFWTGREKDWHLEWITTRLSRKQMNEFLMLVHYFSRHSRVSDGEIVHETRMSHRLKRFRLDVDRRNLAHFAEALMPLSVTKALRKTKFGQSVIRKLK